MGNWEMYDWKESRKEVTEDKEAEVEASLYVGLCHTMS